MNIEAPNAEVIKAESLIVIEKTNAIEVVNHGDYVVAGEALKEIKGRQKFVIEQFKEPKAKAFDAHRAITALEKSILDPLKRAEDTCSRKVMLFLQAEDKRKREAAEKVRREAEEKARVEAEAHRRRDEEERLAVAAQLEAQGFKEEAEELVSQPTQPLKIAPLPEIKPVEDMPKVEGIHTSKRYKAEVNDLMALVKAVAEGKQPITLLQANEQVLNKMASALKLEMNIPGVKVIEEMGLRTRTA